MITIPDKSFNSSLRLSDILYVMKKDELLKIAKRQDFYVSPNVTKDKVAPYSILYTPYFILHPAPSAPHASLRAPH